jgi:hypothetical protein
LKAQLSYRERGSVGVVECKTDITLNNWHSLGTKITTQSGETITRIPTPHFTYNRKKLNMKALKI